MVRPLVLKKNFSIGVPTVKLDLESNRDKKLIALRFFSSINIYVEEEQELEKEEKSRWAKEFDLERFRCLIKFNDPRKGEARDEEIYFDSRKTLGDLKQRLSELIGIPVEEFRVKKSKQALSEMTTYRKKLSELKFINNEIIFLEEGKSSKGSVIVKRGVASIVEDRIDFALFEESQFELEADLVTVQDLSARIASQYNLQPEEVRVREYKFYEFKEIFSRSDLIQRIR